MIRNPKIVTDDEVVHSWKEAASRSLHAANRPLDPALHGPLGRSPQEVVELVVYLSDALTHAGGILLASVANARPEVAVAFHDGLRDLLDEVAAEQAGMTGGEKRPCLLPVEGSDRPVMCTCVDRQVCADIAYDVGRGRQSTGPAGDDGCEGGRR
jgi:hypothetical protein